MRASPANGQPHTTRDTRQRPSTGSELPPNPMPTRPPAARECVALACTLASRATVPLPRTSCPRTSCPRTSCPLAAGQAQAIRSSVQKSSGFNGKAMLAAPALGALQAKAISIESPTCHLDAAEIRCNPYIQRYSIRKDFQTAEVDSRKIDRSLVEASTSFVCRATGGVRDPRHVQSLMHGTFGCDYRTSSSFRQLYYR